jgi:hypothetical protein
MPGFGIESHRIGAFHERAVVEVIATRADARRTTGARNDGAAPGEIEGVLPIRSGTTILAERAATHRVR